MEITSPPSSCSDPLRIARWMFKAGKAWKETWGKMIRDLQRGNISRVYYANEGHVGGRTEAALQTFQHPLTPQEEARQLRLLREGSPEEANAAKDVLILRNLRLVAHVIKKYQIAEEEPEDLLSIGTIGLIKAISSFDESKGRLATYACRCIENEILMLLRSKKKTARDVSLFESIGQDKEGNEIRLLDVIEQEQVDTAAQLELMENITKLRMLLGSVLTEREREIIMLRYGLHDGEEWTQNQIGRMMGISRSYVSRIEKRGLEKLRKNFSKI